MSFPTADEVRRAYILAREAPSLQSIPSEVLELMRDTALAELASHEALMRKAKRVLEEPEKRLRFLEHDDHLYT